MSERRRILTNNSCDTIKTIVIEYRTQQEYKRKRG